MTWVTDNTGTRWVEYEPRKKRVRRKPRRFENIKVGDQVMRRVISRWQTYAKDALASNDPAMIEHEKDCGFDYAIVTDLWHDPVAGQDDPDKGDMVGIQYLRQGLPCGNKRSHTIRGLAAQSYVYADRDEIAHWQAVREAVATGQVVGIGRGRRNRARIPYPIL